MDPPLQPSSSSSSGARILKLHLRRAAEEAAEEEEEASAAAAAAWVRAEGWVDLGLVGRAVGLDPATVRLNGYFLSRGGGTHDDHVSSSLTWGSLLSFFAARALPCGASPAAPLAVLGKTLNPNKSPASPPGTGAASASTVMSSSSLHLGELRDDQSPLKKNRAAESDSIDSQQRSSDDDDDDDDGILCMKRRLRLDDDHRTLKKPRRTAEFCSPGSAAFGRALFSYSCIDEHHGKKKRPREEELTVSSISHKRLR